MTKDKLAYLNQISSDIDSLTKAEENLSLALKKGPQFMSCNIFSLDKDSFEDSSITRRLCEAVKLAVSQELKDLTAEFNEV